MAEGRNVWHGIGHLGADSELRECQDGTPVVSWRMACGKRYRDATGTWRERTNWISCALFGKRAPGLHDRLRKGTRVSVDGEIRTYTYTHKDGTERAGFEIRVRDILPLSNPRGRQIREPAETGEDQED